MTEHALAAWLDRAWRLLEEGVANASAPCRTGVLATAGRAGGAEARWVVLRRAARDLAEVEVHTDSASDKVAELARDPLATLGFYAPDPKVQLRLRLSVRILTGDAVADRWARIPEAARKAYGGEPAPGAPLAAPEDHAPGVSRDRFAVLVGRVDEIDMLHLGADRHRRARFAAADGFAGGWIAP
ncbi:pyridoxamine 5'-phosphate oxidase family protein [Oceaniglobus roseus]|uniref:pyridoxamine 5'-phosphate oxidase family protein n=1 Tax=Oceaniglobus roseus TaxID=1737570 RepID=UPI000C7E9CC9|nr:pyridoxamine 5'-phosphate oxidase family protein [Kandeliimicrobium roseum]